MLGAGSVAWGIMKGKVVEGEEWTEGKNPGKPQVIMVTLTSPDLFSLSRCPWPQQPRMGSRVEKRKVGLGSLQFFLWLDQSLCLSPQSEDGGFPPRCYSAKHRGLGVQGPTSTSQL